MLIEPLIFILRFVASAFVAVLLLRFYMQWIRAPFYSPFAKFAVALTDFAVKPARRLIPGFRGLDWATLVVAWLTQCLVALIAYLLAGRGAWHNPVAGIMILSLIEVIASGLWLIILLQILLTIVSFVNPFSPHMDFLNYLNQPLVRPFRRYLPTVSGVDLSPMVVVLVCLLLLNFVLPALGGALLGLFR